MDFAKKQLEKYGWKDGEGLGKSKSGISTALKVKFKFDKGGLGHNEFDDLNNTWWKRLYDDSAKNIRTKTNSCGHVILETINDSLEITTNRESKKKSKVSQKDTAYKNFVKVSELHRNTEIIIKDEDESEEKSLERKRRKFNSDICEVTDEDLFRICGGRTAHKGARHGLKMNAKLARLEQQEISVLGHFSEQTMKSTNKNSDKKHKKRKEKKLK